MSEEMREQLVNAVKQYNKNAGVEVENLNEVYEEMEFMTDEEAQQYIWILSK